MISNNSKSKNMVIPGFNKVDTGSDGKIMPLQLYERLFARAKKNN